MKRSVIIALGLLAVMCLSVPAQTPVYSVNIVGFQNLQVIGDPGTAVYTLLGAPFEKIPAYKGVGAGITANDTATITDGNAAWTPSQFKTGVTNVEPTGASTFYIEITTTNVPYEGRHFYISDNTATTLTITGGLPSDVGVNALVNLTYKIVAANRVRDIFGEPGSQILAGGAAPAGADDILYWTPSGWSASVYYKTSGLPSSNRNHWNQGSLIVNDLVLDRDGGMLVKRLAGLGSTNLVIAGEVSANAQSIVLSPESGYNLVGGVSVVTTPIGQTTLTNILQGSSAAAGADNILSWSTNGWSAAVYYKTSGLPSSNRGHWNQGSVIVNNTFVFQAGQAYLFKISTNHIWSYNSPLE